MEKDQSCDNCWWYKWYWNWCDRWDCEREKWMICGQWKDYDQVGQVEKEAKRMIEWYQMHGEK